MRIISVKNVALKVPFFLSVVAACLASLILTTNVTNVNPAYASSDSTRSIFSPDLRANPKGTFGYPRIIKLSSAENSNHDLLMTFAKSVGTDPSFLPIYLSRDDGQSWYEISAIRSNTAGWDIEAPTLFEVPVSVPGLNKGDLIAAGTSWNVGDYSSQKIEVFKSIDRGRSWAYLSDCTRTRDLPNQWGHGIWEPSFVIAKNGKLQCYISDERPANTPTNNQVIARYESEDGGKTWAEEKVTVVAFPDDPLLRPGMQTFASLPDGRLVMSYELCRDATDANHACEVFLKYSDDGLSWGALGTRGDLVATEDGRHMLHTPFVSWTPDGGEKGTLFISGQRVVAGPTGNKTVLEESGSVAFYNRNFGKGEWNEFLMPINVSPTGGYSANEPSCPGYSTPVVPIGSGEFVYAASEWLGIRNQCRVVVDRGMVPALAHQIVNEGGKCLDVDTNVSRNGKRVQLWDCGIAAGQRWILGSDGEIQSLGKCLDVDAQGVENETKVQLWECNNSGAQKWIWREDGSIYNPQSGRCLDVSGGRNESGNKLQIYDCNGLWTQKWTLGS